MKCGGCLKNTKDANAIKCSVPNCAQYYCSTCIPFSSISPERKKTWKCPVCQAASKRGGDNSLTPVRAGTDTQISNVTIRKKSELVPEMEPDLKALTLELRHLTKEFTSLNSKLEEVTQSLTHCHDRMDELVDTLKITDARLKSLEQRDQEVIILKATVSGLQSELNLQAQGLLRNEIEIVGISETDNENLQHTVAVAVKGLGIKLEDSDLDFVTRVGARSSLKTAGSNPTLTKRTPRPVVIRLLRRSKRDQILRASKSQRIIQSTDLGLPGETSRIFFNERLTKQNRILFRDTRARARGLGWYCWVSQGVICVREREGKPAQSIRTPTELDLVLPVEKTGPTFPVASPL